MDTKSFPWERFVPAITFAAHSADDMVFGHHLLVSLGCVDFCTSQGIQQSMSYKNA